MILLRNEMTGGRAEGSVMGVEVDRTSWNMLELAWTPAPSPRLGFTLDVITQIGRCYLILQREEMYFKCEFPICHQPIAITSKTH